MPDSKHKAAAMAPPVMVRITMDHMRHEIVQAFNAYATGMVEQVEAEVERCVEGFDYQAEVKRMAHGMLSDVIQNALKDAFRRITWDAALRNALVDAMKRELGKLATEEPGGEA